MGFPEIALPRATQTVDRASDLLSRRAEIHVTFEMMSQHEAFYFVQEMLKPFIPVSIEQDMSRCSFRYVVVSPKLKVVQEGGIGPVINPTITTLKDDDGDICGFSFDWPLHFFEGNEDMSKDDKFALQMGVGKLPESIPFSMIREPAPLYTLGGITPAPLRPDALFSTRPPTDAETAEIERVRNQGFIPGVETFEEFENGEGPVRGDEAIRHLMSDHMPAAVDHAIRDTGPRSPQMVAQQHERLRLKTTEVKASARILKQKWDAPSLDKRPHPLHIHLKTKATEVEEPT